MSQAHILAEQRGKRLYEMTPNQLRKQAEHYESAGNEFWARLCREQINLTYSVAEAFARSCRE